MPGHYGKKKGYEMEKNSAKKQAMKNPSTVSGTGSCTSKAIRKYN